MKNLIFVIAVFFSCAAVAFAQTRTNLRLAPEAKVRNETFRLGDIAQISGGDDEKVKRLQMISLGYAPNVGMMRELPKEKIQLAIAAAGFSANDFSLDSPPIIRVSRAGQQISPAQIRQAVEQTILGQFSESKLDARIVKLDLPEKIDLPIGKVEIRANFANVANPFTPFPLAIEIRVDDQVARRISVNAEIEAYADVFVAAKALSADANISESDVRLEKRRLEKPLANYLRDQDKLRGIKLVKNLAEGAELTADSFVAVVVVRSGDLVRIVGQSGKMQITVSGEARTSGKIGDRIAVKNSQSNQVIQATVVDEGLVKIFF